MNSNYSIKIWQINESSNNVNASKAYKYIFYENDPVILTSYIKFISEYEYKTFEDIVNKNYDKSNFIVKQFLTLKESDSLFFLEKYIKNLINNYFFVSYAFDKKINNNYYCCVLYNTNIYLGHCYFSKKGNIIEIKGIRPHLLSYLSKNKSLLYIKLIIEGIIKYCKIYNYELLFENNIDENKNIPFLVDLLHDMTFKIKDSCYYLNVNKYILSNKFKNYNF